MADSKITALTSISTSTDPANDPLVIVDVSDTSMAATGTTKKVTLNQLLGASGTATLASATVTGNATAAAFIPSGSTVPTNGTYLPSANTVGWAVNSTNAMTLNSTGLGVGVASPNQKFVCAGPRAYFAGGGAVYGIGIGFNTTRTAADHVFFLGATDSATPDLVFSGASGAALMRLAASGNLLVGTTTDIASIRMQVWSSQSDNTAYLRNSNATPYGLSIRYTAATPNNTGSEFLYCEDTTALRASIRSNGGIANYQANNVSLSDSRLKTDIKPLASYWNKIKSLELVTFKYKDQTHSDDNIGLIAQQVESVAPELVDVDGFGETPDDGVPLKTIYTTDLYHAAIKALQEAMTRIEALEAKLA